MIDLSGQAIFDYHFKLSKSKLFVHDRFGPKVEMPVDVYFRTLKNMPFLEKKALGFCKGKVLDIGAGAGAHALELQNRGMEVIALEISPKACEVLRDRHIKNVVCKNIFEFYDGKYDTLLMLMNGIGFCGTLGGFVTFLNQTEKLLLPGGQILFDSCDISYMYENRELPNHYFGEFKCRYEYKKKVSDWFKWLYIDKNMLSTIADSNGYKLEILAEDCNAQFLARLSHK